VPGPPLSSPSSSLQAPDHRALARTDPQHTAAETKALQHASKAVEAGVARARRQHALRRPPTGRPYPRRSGLYKPPPIKRGDAHHSQLPPRHHLSLPLALVHRHLHRRRGTGREPRHHVGPPLVERTPELEEECCRILFRTSPSSSASSMCLAIAVVFLAVRR
jgi:hypothetical protein